MADFYEVLGFKRSPFYRTALSPREEDFKYFAGRSSDVKAFLMNLHATGVHIVSGKRGVGKTTFVNAMQYLTSSSHVKEKLEKYDINFFPEKMMPCYKKLQLEEEDNVDKFLMKVISGIIFSAEEFAEENDLDLNEMKLFRVEKEKFRELLKEGVGKAEVAVDTTTKSEILQSLVQAIRKDFDREGIYLTIDNLDLVDIRVLTKQLNALRDFLFIDGLSIVLLGPEGLYQDLRSSEDGVRILDRLSGYETKLEPLNKEEVFQILGMRRKFLATDSSNPPPIPLSSNFIGKIYDLTDGQTRLLFRICENITKEVLYNYPTEREINDSDAEEHLKEVVNKEVSLSVYTKKQRQLMESCLDEPLRPKDYRQLKLDSRNHFVRLASRLIKDELIEKRSVSSAVFYEPTGLLKLARHVQLI